MTIYNVIDNHKKTGAVSGQTPLNWTILSGATILQGGNPFFIPDFAKRFEARPSLALRICRLGKNIAPRFAHRYVDAVAPCINFIATDLLDSLRESGLPWTKAVCFDRSAAFGKYIPYDMDSIDSASVGLRVTSGDGSEELLVWEGKDFRIPARDVISEISRDNTLKNGDVILAATAPAGPAVEIGQHAELSLDGNISVKFNIR